MSERPSVGGFIDLDRSSGPTVCSPGRKFVDGVDTNLNRQSGESTA